MSEDLTPIEKQALQECRYKYENLEYRVRQLEDVLLEFCFCINNLNYKILNIAGTYNQIQGEANVRK